MTSVPLTHARGSRLRRLRLTGLTGLAAAALVLAACGGGGSSTTAPEASAPAASSEVDTLKIANGVAIDTLDPAENAANESIWLDQNIYARLVQTDPAGTKVVPDLASSWDTSTDGLTWTFHLNPDAKFADGTAVTASDAAWSINRARALEGGWGFLITPVTSVTASDPQTVVIKLKTKHAPLLADLAMYAFGILPQKAVEADKDFFNKTPYGAGPFKVTKLDPDSQLVLTRNDSYWGPKPKISTVEVSVVTNDNTRVLQLQGGQVDVIENPPGNLLKQLSANPKLKVDLFPSTRVDFMQVPLKTKPFEDVRVRQAVKAALDLDAMNTLAYQGNATPANTFFPYKMLYWAESIQAPKPDLDKAKQLLSEAGYPNGFKTDLITVSGDAAGQAQAVVIKDDLAKVGIEVTIQSYEQSTAYTNERSGTNGLGLRYWTNDIIDPDEVATFGADIKGGANSFSSYWGDDATTKAINEARSETDENKRAELYTQVQQTVADQAPFIPLAYPPFRYASGAWVNGFQVSPLGNYNDSLLSLTVGTH
ncbi:ABC transporter substrate-binding protein [Microlunatus flavus]|uniref:Peptide/nickel transport system substrate-binding protein n=1 Tax=Microlunatus flavus TaxID=1036181 RepID=A0A1H9GZP5_9ACTN|nr:ABC transporter substrate-binding protein [Microlunatus flavus]SEQ55592.1 peptide/nickel transport system substrate-binding protein [Microlunatus flavus]